MFPQTGPTGTGRTGRRWAVACILSALVAAAPARASILELIDEKTRDVGAQIQNARARMNKGMSGFGDPDAPEPRTFTEACCRRNITKMIERLRSVHSLLGQVKDYYDERQNITALGIVGQMEVRLSALVQGMALFARADEEVQARNALRGMSRPWNEFRRGLNALEGCCPITGLEPREANPGTGDADPAATGDQDRPADDPEDD